MNRISTPAGRRSATLALVLGLGLGCAGGGAGGVGDLMSAVGGGGMSQGTIAAGLTEALEVATSGAVSQTSALGGFSSNPKIAIPLPDTLDTMAKGLRAVGMSKQVDELELTMNRAAEQAAGEAKDVFWSSIKQMTFSDARGILDGGDTAATQYFERTTRDQLFARFEPIVEERMGEVGLVRLYDSLVDRYTAVPLVKAPSLDLTGYVTNGALDGLFTVLGEKEREIRVDPAARTTELLQKVFSQQ